MPISPEAGARNAAAVARGIDDTEGDLLRLLAALLKRGDPGSPTWVHDHLVLADRLATAAKKAGDKLGPQLTAKVAEAVKNAYSSGAAAALPDLKTLGVQSTAIATPAALTSSRLASLPSGHIRAALQRLPQVIGAAYSQAVAAGAREVLGGQTTRLQVSQHVLDRLLGGGIGGFTDSAGRNWKLDTYVEMAVRTTTGRAAVQGHTDQLQDAGMDLVIVGGIGGSCPLCVPYEDQILSLSGNNVGVVTVPNALDGTPEEVEVMDSLDNAQADGFQHPNCRHTVSAYLPGATNIEPTEPDPELYKASQRQRAMESNVRSWKRRQDLALTPEAKAKASGKISEWQGALRQHVAENNLPRLSYREQIGRAH